jgi:hypothetical protein
MAYCYKRRGKGETSALRARLFGRWSTHLSQVPLDDDIIGKLEQTSGVAVQVVPLGLAETVKVELSNLGVLALGTFVPPVRLSRDDIVGDLVRRLDGIHTGESGGRLGRRDVLVVRVGEVHGLAARVGLHSGADRICQRWTADI